jgi:hypothetical protein
MGRFRLRFEKERMLRAAPTAARAGGDDDAWG